MAEYTARIEVPDEDGMCNVTIFYPDGTEEGGITLRSDMAHQWVEQELAILNDPRRGEECEHGLSAALCSGPRHY